MDEEIKFFYDSAALIYSSVPPTLSQAPDKLKPEATSLVRNTMDVEQNPGLQLECASSLIKTEAASPQHVGEHEKESSPGLSKEPCEVDSKVWFVKTEGSSTVRNTTDIQFTTTDQNPVGVQLECEQSQEIFIKREVTSPQHVGEHEEESSSEKLIAAVFRRPTIWDPSDSLRKNGKFMKTLWEEVAEEIGITVKVAKSKWKNLRAYFTSVHRSITLDQPRSGSEGTCTWAYYNQMLFLKDVVSADGNRGDSLTFASYQNPETLLGLDDEETVTDLLAAPVSKPPTSIPTYIESHASTLGTSTQGITASLKKQQINKRKRSLGFKKKHGPFNDRAWLDIEARKIQLLERDADIEGNDDLLFFKSLVPCMKHFSIRQKLRVRTAIQEIVLGELDRTENSSSGSGGNLENWPSDGTH